MGDVVLGICQISDMGKESKLSEGFCSKHCEASGRQWIKEKFIRYSKEPGEDANIQEYDVCTPEYQNRKCNPVHIWCFGGRIHRQNVEHLMEPQLLMMPLKL